jgi:dephospho-CoA kinase
VSQHATPVPQHRGGSSIRPAAARMYHRSGRTPPVRFTHPVVMVGLTGGIGAGKSVVARRLAELGAIVIDADQLARQVVAPGTDGLAEVVAAFGAGILTPDGSLDRPALARLVFADEAARHRLEGIIHPRVRARTKELVAAAPPDAVLVNDVPLLVEAGRPDSYDLVIVVLSDEPNRIARLRRTRGMSAEEARSRMATQATDEQRRAVADVLLVNDGAVDDLLEQVDRVWRERLVRT